MTEPRTVAGRALLSDEHEDKGSCYTSPDCPHGNPILAIEAEAVAARDRELRAAVEALIIYRFPETMDERPFLDRTRVLALLADPES